MKKNEIFLILILIFYLLSSTSTLAEEPLSIKDPKSAKDYYTRGTLLINQNFDQAISDFTKAIELNPNFASAYHNRAIAYSKKGDDDRAILDLSKTIEIDPKLSLAYLNRAQIYENKGKFDLAISDHTSYIKLLPSDSAHYYFRANIYRKKGDFEKAIADYSKAIELGPHTNRAYEMRAKAYFELKNYDKAWEDVNSLKRRAVPIDSKFLEELKSVSATAVSSTEEIGLMKAIKSKNIDQIKKLIDNGVDINSQVEDFGGIAITPLCLASQKCNEEIMRLLLSKGAKVNLTDGSGLTPLHRVVHKNCISAIELLLDGGADIDAKDDEYGRTPLMNASIFPREAFKYLIVRGADVNEKDNKGNTALIFTAEYGRKKDVELLLSKGAQVNVQNVKGRTPLILAVWHNPFEAKDIVELFLSKNADVNAQIEGGKTALMLAASREKPEMIELLLAKGAKINAKDKRGRTALMCATIDKAKNSIGLLLSKGANPTIRDNNGQTALMLAESRKKLCELSRFSPFYEEIDWENTNLLHSPRINPLLLNLVPPDTLDGKVVFTANVQKYATEHSSFNAELFIADEDGSNQERLTFTQKYEEAKPLWAKDGKIVYVCFSTKEPMSHYIMDKDGSNKQKISKAEYNSLKNEK